MRYTTFARMQRGVGRHLLLRWSAGGTACVQAGALLVHGVCSGSASGRDVRQEPGRSAVDVMHLRAWVHHLALGLWGTPQ